MNQTLRIAHVVPSLANSHGGVSTAVRNLALAQAASGSDVRVYVGYGPDDAAEAPAVFHRPVMRDGLPVVQSPFVGGPLAERYSRCPGLARMLERCLDQHDIVHVHSMWNICVLRASMVCRRHGMPHVVSPHGGLDPRLVRTRQPVRSLYLELFERRRLERAAVVHFTTRLEMQLASGLRLRVRPAVVPLGVEDLFLRATISREEARRALGLPPDAFVVLQMGRLNEFKGIELLLDAWAGWDEGSERLLWIVGPGDERYVTQLERQADRLGVSGRVRFEGPIYGRARAAAYRAADLVTLCSRKENFGLSAAESLACGVPVLVSDRVNLADQIRRANCGIVCGYRRESMARALLDLQRLSPAQRTALGEAGREWARTHWDWDAVARQTEAVYRQALDGGFESVVL